MIGKLQASARQAHVNLSEGCIRNNFGDKKILYIFAFQIIYREDCQAIE
jgi:hypothetical protein